MTTESCVICTLDLETSYTLKCKHTFHADCILECILFGRETCPLCRSDMKLEDLCDFNMGFTDRFIGNMSMNPTLWMQKKACYNPYLLINIRYIEIQECVCVNQNGSFGQKMTDSL